MTEDNWYSPEFMEGLIKDGWTEDEIERARLGLPLELTPELARKMRECIEGIAARSGVPVTKLAASLNGEHPYNKKISAKIFGDTGEPS